MIIGLPRMHKEAGELRDFLPDFVSYLARTEVGGVVIEEGYGTGMGFRTQDYLRRSPKIKVGSVDDCLAQDLVIVVRAPAPEALEKLRRGALLLSMLHYATQPRRNALLIDLGIRAVSLDSVVDDRGRRLVENMTAVGWNAMETAFAELRRRYVAFEDPERPPLRATILGSGSVAGAAAFAAARYGDQDLRARMVAKGVPGVEIRMIDHDLTSRETYLLGVLKETDVLIDATRRPDPTRTVVPNRLIAAMPQHAVIADLSADPYDFDVDPPIVKAIEGVPQGDLDHYVFHPDDRAYEDLVGLVDISHRRVAASCYSWPGIHPLSCMELYGAQIEPLLHVLLNRAPGTWDVDSDDHLERSLARAEIERWMHTSTYSR